MFRLVAEKRTKMVAVKRLGSADLQRMGIIRLLMRSKTNSVQSISLQWFNFSGVFARISYSTQVSPHFSPTCCHSLNKLSSIISAYPELIISLYGTNLNKSLEATEAQKPKALNQNSHVKLFKYLPLIWNYSEITRCLWISLLVLEWFGITKGRGVSEKARGGRCFPLKRNKQECSSNCSTCNFHSNFVIKFRQTMLFFH